MEDQSLVRTAKTVEEAIELATLELGVDRDEIEIDVISTGRSGILGIGAEPAKVSVRMITDDDGTARTALGIVSRLLEDMDVEASPTIRSSGSGPEDPAIIDIQGEDAGLLIGHRGETLRALQFTVNLILNQGEHRNAGVIVDVEQYRERRHRQLRVMAEKMAQRAIAENSEVTLEAMPAADRRIVHMALADYTGVETQSSGEGNQRRVTITSTGEVDPSSVVGDRPRRRRRGPPRDR